MNATEVSSTILVFVLIGLAILLWLAPTIVAVRRNMPNKGAVIVVDLLLGWTFIGWIVALAMACGSKPQPVAPVVYPPLQQGGAPR